MKTLKTKMLMALLLVSLCVAGFTVKSENEKILVKKSALASGWFLYTGPHPATISDLFNPANYSRYYGNPFLLCIGNHQLCAIWANEVYGGGSPQPDLTNNGAGSIGFELYMYYQLGFTSSNNIKLKFDE